MKTYIAILKGINVGGHKKIMMADLRKLLCEISYIGEVNTYIQSGNIVFKASEENTDVLENLIQQKRLRDPQQVNLNGLPIMVKS